MMLVDTGIGSLVFWKVFETILLPVMDRDKSRKVTAVVGVSISHRRMPKLFTSVQNVFH